jgi:hypothetical protein
MAEEIPRRASQAIPRRPAGNGFDTLSRDLELRPENSLGNAVHIAASAIAYAAGFAAIGAIGARVALAVVLPRASREMRWLAPSLTGSIAAILGAQQGTLHALVNVQPVASFAILKADLDDALERERDADVKRGGGRGTTFVMREHRRWSFFSDKATSAPPELIAHSNTVDREAVARHTADRTAAAAVEAASQVGAPLQRGR